MFGTKRARYLLITDQAVRIITHTRPQRTPAPPPRLSIFDFGMRPGPSPWARPDCKLTPPSPRTTKVAEGGSVMLLVFTRPDLRTEHVRVPQCCHSFLYIRSVGEGVLFARACIRSKRYKAPPSKPTEAPPPRSQAQPLPARHQPRPHAPFLHGACGARLRLRPVVYHVALRGGRGAELHLAGRSARLGIVQSTAKRRELTTRHSVRQKHKTLDNYCFVLLYNGVSLWRVIRHFLYSCIPR